MRVVIAGGRGLLGGAVAREFAQDHDVIVLDRVALDVTDERAVHAVMAAHLPNLIVSCAAYNNVDAAEDEPELALRVNAFAVRALARAASATGAALVHFSSDFVFDGETDVPYSEEARANPRGVYAASKLLGDWFALEAPRAYVLRVESLFGPPAAGGGRRGSLGTIIDTIRRGDEVPVFVDRVVSPSYTPDISRAVRSLVEREAPAGVYHCVNSGQATWVEIAERAAALMGLPLQIRPLTLQSAGLRARRPRYSALSNAKLIEAGARMRPWEDALAEFVAGATVRAPRLA